jgi:hypothetical protein
MAAWNTNWETTEGVGKLPCEALNELRTALLCIASLSSAFAVHANCFEVSETRLVPASWFTAFDNAVSYLLNDEYIRHDLTVSEDETYGYNYCAFEYWREANMLSAIGDASLVSTPESFANSAAWMFQRKKILDKLRWYYSASGRTLVGVYEKESREGGWGDSPDWPESWTEIEDSTDIRTTQEVDSVAADSWYRRRQYYRAQYDIDLPTGLFARFSLAATVAKLSHVTNFKHDWLSTAGSYVVINAADPSGEATTEYEDEDSLTFDVFRIDGEPSLRSGHGSEGSEIAGHRVYRLDGLNGFEHLN